MTPIERVFLHKAIANHERTQSILARLGNVTIETVERVDDVFRKIGSSRDLVARGKRMLFLTEHKGNMVAKCPGTSDHICCGYQVLDLMSGCPMDCSYCILQAYLNNPVITVFVNLLDLIDGVEGMANRIPWRFLRVGPGELSDSLALDHMTRFTDELVTWFAGHRDRILELKTKSDRVDHLLNLWHAGQTVVSWSLNPPSIISSEEHGTPSLAQRLIGARRCQEAGYPIGLHFDPMIFECSWEREYREMVEQVFHVLDSRRVIWISMGALRFSPSLRPIIQDRFPQSRILLGELFPGRDGKLRYLETIRVHMFRKMLSWLHQIDPGLYVYLCMESHEVWKAVFGWSPGSTAGLARVFDQRCGEFLERGHGG